MSEKSPEKTIVILKSEPNSLKAAESFLINRGWNIFSTCDLKDAFVELYRDMPKYFLISIEFPLKNIQMIPSIISQALPIYVIGFAESSKASVIRQLTEFNSRYTLFPQVTGPSIERLIFKINKEEETALKHAHASFKKSTQLEPEKVRTSYILGGRNARSKSDIMQFVKSMVSVDRGSYEIDIGKLKSNLFDLTKTVNQNAGKDVHFSLTEEKSVSNKKLPLDLKDRKPNIPIGSSSILVRGTEHAIQTQEVFGKGVITEQVEIVSNASCLIIESTRFAGYLVAAFGKNRVVEPGFIEVVKSRLLEFLKNSGEKVGDDEAFDVKIREVDFNSFAREKAEFLRKSLHQGKEVVFAFFPSVKAKANLEETQYEQMLMIDLEEIRENIEVQFNLYLYLPKNDRYILYTPKGDVFESSKKKKLQNAGHKKMHVLKTDLKEVLAYKTQIYLNDKIDEFLSKKKNSAA